jgi:hypothetical protein
MSPSSSQVDTAHERGSTHDRSVPRQVPSERQESSTVHHAPSSQGNPTAGSLEQLDPSAAHASFVHGLESSQSASVAQTHAEASTTQAPSSALQLAVSHGLDVAQARGVPAQAAALEQTSLSVQASPSSHVSPTRTAVVHAPATQSTDRHVAPKPGQSDGASHRDSESVEERSATSSPLETSAWTSTSELSGRSGKHAPSTTKEMDHPRVHAASRREGWPVRKQRVGILCTEHLSGLTIADTL